MCQVSRAIGRAHLYACQGCLVAAGVPTPAKEDSDAEMQVVPVPLNLVTAISTLRVSIPPDLRPADPRKATLLTVKASSAPTLLSIDMLLPRAHAQPRL